MRKGQRSFICGNKAQRDVRLFHCVDARADATANIKGHKGNCEHNVFCVIHVVLTVNNRGERLNQL